MSTAKMPEALTPAPFTTHTRLMLSSPFLRKMGWDNSNDDDKTTRAWAEKNPKTGVIVLALGCQKHTLKTWRARGDRIISDNVANPVTYPAGQLNVATVQAREVRKVKRLWRDTKPVTLPEGSTWAPSAWSWSGGGDVVTPKTEEEMRTEAEAIVAKRIKSTAASMDKATRALTSLYALLDSLEEALS